MFEKKKKCQSFDDASLVFFSLQTSISKTNVELVSLKTELEKCKLYKNYIIWISIFKYKLNFKFYKKIWVAEI